MDEAPRLRLLGHAAVAGAGGAWQPLARKDAALLARLALDGRHGRTEMAAWLWPEVPLPRAHANLRQRLFRLRQAAGPLIAEAGDGLALAVASDLDRDDAQFDAPLLGSLAAADDPVQDWIDDARRRWLARRADRMSGLAARHEQAGALAAALALTERLLALEPLLEHAWRGLMRLHFLRGDRAAAVAAFERCERVLRDELGLKPSPETLALLAQVEALAAPGPAPAPVPLPPALRRPPRRIGRDAEWTAMQAAWAAGQAFVLRGDAGLGKSRLLADFEEAQRPGTLRVAALPGDEALPYALVLRLLQAFAQRWPDGRWCPEGPLRAELARLWPALGPAPAAPGLQALLHEALHAAFARAAAAGLAGVLVDDVQQADAASLALLQAAAAGGGALRWGFAARPGAATEGWSSGSGRVLTLPLAPLPPATLQALLDSLELPDPPPPALAERLARHCGGNPLFLLEMLKLLRRDPAAAAAADLPLPASVEALVVQRLEALPAPAQALLRVAAVAGGDFDAEVAAEVLGEPLADLAEAWHAAEAAQALTPAGFVHDLLRSALRARLPQPLAAALHERIGAALQRRGAAAARVAAQFDAAGRAALAAPAWRRAADDALRLGRVAECMAHLGSAAEAFDAAGDGEAAFEARVAALPERLALDGVAPALAAAEELLPQAGTPARQVMLQLAVADVALRGYRFEAAREAADAVLALAPADAPAVLPARLIARAARSWLGAPLEAAEAAALEAALKAEPDPLRAAPLWGHWATSLHATGRVQACTRALVRTQALAAAAGRTELEAQALGSLAGQRLLEGDVDASLADAGRAMALQRRLGDRHGERVAATNRAITLVGCERLQEALALVDEVSPRPATPESDGLERIADELRAEIWLRAGRPERALAHLQVPPAPSLPLARHLQQGLLVAWAQQLAGDPAAAAEGWRRLLALAPAGQGIGVALRTRALAGVVLPAAEALADLDGMVARADAAGAPASSGLARLRRAAWRHRVGDGEGAREDLAWLLAQRPRLRHLYLPMAELLALAERIAPDAARRAEAQRWAAAELLPRLPEAGPAAEADWRRCPAWAGLFSAGA